MFSPRSFSPRRCRGITFGAGFGLYERAGADLRDEYRRRGSPSARRRPQEANRFRAGGSWRLLSTSSFLPGGGISWDLAVIRITGGIEISGRISGGVTLECSRCLEDFDQPVDLRLREHALWLDSEDIEPGDDYAEEYLVLDGTMDLLPVLRDAICLSLPSRRICSDQCRGICPVCGVNLNLEQCGCTVERVDSRLKPLLELKKRMEKK